VRTLKQLLFLLVAILALNALRFRPAPAEVNGQPPARSGDTNCDGKIDITDPIIVLNWLFSDGPEPCAIAQGDACCESLRAEIAARMPLPDDIVCQRGVISSAQPGTKPILSVPQGKRFVVTSYSSRFGGINDARLVSITGGTSTYITEGTITAGMLGGWVGWSSGFVFPAGSDVGIKVENVYVPPEIDYYINGYFVAE